MMLLLLLLILTLLLLFTLSLPLTSLAFSFIHHQYHQHCYSDNHSIYKLIHKWAEFVVPMYAYQPEFLTEMYAYNAAAAHLKLRHQLIDSFTIEQINSPYEGWSLVDDIAARSDYCVDLHGVQDSLPFALHACQPVSVGPWYFIKYFVPDDIFSCAKPLLTVPNSIELDKYSHAFPPWDKYKLIELWNSTMRKRNAFLYCQIIRYLNEASIYFKKTHCGPLGYFQDGLKIDTMNGLYFEELDRLGISGLRASFD
jgi:hypothetical protein